MRMFQPSRVMTLARSKSLKRTGDGPADIGYLIRSLIQSAANDSIIDARTTREYLIARVITVGNSASVGCRDWEMRQRGNGAIYDAT